jgi:hypothetical protein
MKPVVERFTGEDVEVGEVLEVDAARIHHGCEGKR